MSNATPLNHNDIAAVETAVGYLDRWLGNAFEELHEHYGVWGELVVMCDGTDIGHLVRGEAAEWEFIATAATS